MLRSTFRAFSATTTVPPIAPEKLAALLSSPSASSPLANSGWGVKPPNPALGTNGKQILTKQFIFKDFHNAWAFMNSVVPKINAMDHHPEWFNVYNRVVIELTTHDAGNRISEKDVKLATHLEEMSKKFE